MEHPMTSPTQRRHDEILGRLDALIDAVRPPRLVIPPSNFKFDRDAIARWMMGEDDEPADITEEPPRGSQVTDRGGDVWERREGGWALWWAERSGWVADLCGCAFSPWPTVREQAPLRFTTDEDRKRVGLPLRSGACDGCGNPIPVARCVCATCDHDNSTKPAPADVDPDEALARVLRDASIGWFNSESDAPSVEAAQARAAREHIEANQLYAYRKVAAERDKADAERDVAKEEAVEAHSAAIYAEHRARKAEADVERLTRERDEWKARHAALRGAVVTDPSILRMAAADIEAQGTGFGGLPRSLPETLRRLADVLVRDTERGGRDA